MASGEGNLAPFIGLAEISLNGLVWQRLVQSTIAAASIGAAGLPFVSSSIDTENVPVHTGVADDSAFGLPFSSLSVSSQNIQAAAGNATISANGIGWVSSATDVANTSPTIGLVEIAASGLPWVSQAADTASITHQTGVATIQASGLPYVSVPAVVVGIAATTGQAEGTLHGLLWASGASASDNISMQIGSAETRLSGLVWASQATDAIRIDYALGLASGQLSGLPWSSGAVDTVAISSWIGLADGRLSGLQWVSNVAFVGNIQVTAGTANIRASGLGFSTASAGSVGISSTTGSADVQAGGLEFVSSGSAVTSITSFAGKADHSAHGLPFIVGTAAATNISSFPGRADDSASGRPWVSTGSATVSISPWPGFADDRASPLPFATNGGVALDTAVCIAGTFSDPAYLASTAYLGNYNPLGTNGYVSMWYLYNSTAGDQILHFNEDNILFTVWGGVEGDRIEFGLMDGFDEYADQFIKVVGDFGFNKVRAISTIDITDGNWHHLMFGGPGIGNGQWWFFIDGIRMSVLINESGVNNGEWFPSVHLPGGHENDVGATRVSGSNDGTSYLFGCVDELMIVNDRSPVAVQSHPTYHPGDPEYLYNSGNGVRIPEVENENFDGLWDDVYNAWEFNAGNVGHEYVDGVYNFTTRRGTNLVDGIAGKKASQAIEIGQGTTRRGLRIQAADKPFPNHNGSFTVLGWVKLYQKPPTTNAGLMTKLYNGQSEWALWYDAAQNRFRATIWSGTSTLYAYPTAYDVQIGKWYLIAMRCQASVLGLQISIGAEDAPLEHGTNYSSLPARNSNCDVLIGMYGLNTEMWPGALDDVAYWTRRLSDAELLSVFNSGAGRAFSLWPSNLLTNLVFHFGLNEAYGVRVDSWGDNVGTDGSRYKALPTVSQEPFVIDGHVQEP